MADRDLRIKRTMIDNGVSPARAEAALELDGILQQWRRRAIKRELGLRAIAELGLPLDLALLDALIAVWRPANEFGDNPSGETTVGSIATRLGIDPSRASRLTTELIRKGLVRRAVSRQDGRRAILAVTEDGDRMVQAIRGYKFLTLGHFLSGWSEEEIRTFLPLMERFSAWSDAPDDPSGRIGAEIRALRESIADLTDESARRAPAEG